MIAVQGKIVTEKGESLGRIEINEKTGLIEKVGAPASHSDINTENCLIFPGFIDIHVHAREDQSGTQIYKEDFRTVSEAAINGGVTHIADMPNNPEAPTNDEKYQAKKILSQKSLIPVTLYAAIGPETEPLSFKVPYKVFMGKSVGNTFFSSYAELENCLKKYKNQNISFHCEDPKILEASAAESTHGRRRPKEAEISAVKFALYLTEKYNLETKLCHLSTKEAVAEVGFAKERGLKVSAEVTPHHLFFDEKDQSQMNPPLRSSNDRLGLIDALQTGIIDYLASDHAPHTKEERLKGISGVPQLDTYGLFAAWLIKSQGFSPQDIARVCSYNPGQFVRPFLSEELGKGFGKIEKGYAGSLTILDLATPTQVDENSLKTKCGWSPLQGMIFPGRVRYTVSLGKIYEIP